MAVTITVVPACSVRRGGAARQGRDPGHVSEASEGEEQRGYAAARARVSQAHGKEKQREGERLERGRRVARGSYPLPRGASAARIPSLGSMAGAATPSCFSGWRKTTTLRGGRGRGWLRVRSKWARRSP
jgi:hypothetical protein